MKVVQFNPKLVPEFVKRPAVDVLQLFPKIQSIADAVQNTGDLALRQFTQEFDKVDIQEFKVPKSEIEAAKLQISDELQTAIGYAKNNIEVFHRKQTTESYTVEQIQGLSCQRKWFPIDSVGLYIPGGSAPLFSTVIMLAVPAEIADNPKRILCSPPNPKTGKIHPAILYTADVCGITEIYAIGGAQAICAMAFGTESVPKVDKIFGPGNAYVTAAKQFVSLKGTAIDMPAGPSEVLIIADNHANASFVAADLLSQAEHGPDSQVVLCCYSSDFAEAVNVALEEQLETLPRADIARQSLENSFSIVFEESNALVDFVNMYAPEHLIIQTDDASSISKHIRNAGSVFIGPYTPESLGDYASGTNHTLPTSAWAKSISGLSVDNYRKSITYQSASASALQVLGPIVEVMAQAEQLDGHARAVRIRIDQIEADDFNR